MVTLAFDKACLAARVAWGEQVGGAAQSTVSTPRARAIWSDPRTTGTSGQQFRSGPDGLSSPQLSGAGVAGS